MTPAVANGMAMSFVRPSDGNVKSVVFPAPPLFPALPITVDGSSVIPVVAGVVSVVVDGALAEATTTGPVTTVLMVVIDGIDCPLVVVGSVLALSSGHVFTVLPANGSSPTVIVG